MMDGVTLLIKAPRLIAWQRHLPSSPTLFPTALTLQVRLSQRCRGVFWCYEASGIQNRSRATLKARQCLAWGLLSPFSSFFGEGKARTTTRSTQSAVEAAVHSSGSKAQNPFMQKRLELLKNKFRASGNKTEFSALSTHKKYCNVEKNCKKCLDWLIVHSCLGFLQQRNSFERTSFCNFYNV